MALFGTPIRGVVLPGQTARTFVGPRAQGELQTIGIPFDCLVTESPEYSSTPTSNVLEDGADAADHVKIEPMRLTIDAIISASSAALVQAQIRGVNELLGQQEVAGSIPGAPFVVREAHRKLKGHLVGKTIVDIVAGLEVYTDMVFVSYTPTRDAARGNVLHFSAVLQQIRIVQSETRFLPKERTVKSAATTQKTGKQPATAPTAPVAAKGSVLYETLKGAGGYR